MFFWFNICNNYNWTFSIIYSHISHWFYRPSIGIRIKPSSVFFAILFCCCYSHSKLTENGTTADFGSWMTFRIALEMTKTGTQMNLWRKRAEESQNGKKVVLYKWPLKKLCSTIQNLRLHMLNGIFWCDV